MDLTPETVGASLSELLMRAVANSGVVKPDDAELACRVMREELKAFVCGGPLCGPKYADERYLLRTGQAQLAWGSFVIAVVRRIVAEKEGRQFAGLSCAERRLTNSEAGCSRSDDEDKQD